MSYLVSQVEQWGAEIDAMPAPDPGSRKVGKKEAIVLLAGKLRAAARRGFSTTELHEALSAMGLKVHVDTLRSALKAAGRHPAKRPMRERRSRGDLGGLEAESHRAVARPAARDANGSSDDKATPRAAAAERTEGRNFNGETSAGRPEKPPTLASGHGVRQSAVSHTTGAPGDQDVVGGMPVAITRVDRLRRPAKAVSLERPGERKSERLGTTHPAGPVPRQSSINRGAFLPREDSDEL